MSAQIDKQKGIAFATSRYPYSHPEAEESLRRLATTGANRVGLVVAGSQETAASTSITYGQSRSTSAGTGRSSTDEQLLHAIALAHSLGLKVFLQTPIHIADQRLGSWLMIGRHFRNEADWDAGFASYRDFIDHYARLAQSAGVEALAVGVELRDTDLREREWRETVARVRAVYIGALTYAGLVSEGKRITWWDALDHIGIDAVPSLTNQLDPPVDELKAGWQRQANGFAQLSARWNKQIVFTQIGSRSIVGFWQDPEYRRVDAVSLDEQTKGYQAMFETLFGQPWVAGMFLWQWFTDPFEGGPCDITYSPQDKPAEEIIRSWYGGSSRSRPAPPSQSSYEGALPIYGSEFDTGWVDGSQGATLDLSATGPDGGPTSIAAVFNARGRMILEHEALDTLPYQWLELFVQGAAPGGQRLTVAFKPADGPPVRSRPLDDCRYLSGGAVLADQWQRVLVPLDDLGVQGQPVVQLIIQEVSGVAGSTIRIDAIRLLPAGST